ASVSPKPAVSRSRANDSATNAEVPHPMTSTRSPLRVSTRVASSRSSSDRRQTSGWLSISREVMFMWDYAPAAGWRWGGRVTAPPGGSVVGECFVGLRGGSLEGLLRGSLTLQHLRDGRSDGLREPDVARHR